MSSAVQRNREFKKSMFSLLLEAGPDCSNNLKSLFKNFFIRSLKVGSDKGIN